MKTQITCPECNHQFDVENALSKDIEQRLKEEFQEKFGKLKSDFSDKEKELATEKERLEQLALNQKELVAKLASKKMEEQLDKDGP